MRKGKICSGKLERLSAGKDWSELIPLQIGHFDEAEEDLKQRRSPACAHFFFC
jgi:hypothetical protein